MHFLGEKTHKNSTRL